MDSESKYAQLAAEVVALGELCLIDLRDPFAVILAIKTRIHEHRPISYLPHDGRPDARDARIRQLEALVVMQDQGFKARIEEVTKVRTGRIPSAPLPPLTVEDTPLTRSIIKAMILDDVYEKAKRL